MVERCIPVGAPDRLAYPASLAHFDQRPRGQLHGPAGIGPAARDPRSRPHAISLGRVERASTLRCATEGGVDPLPPSDGFYARPMTRQTYPPALARCHAYRFENSPLKRLIPRREPRVSVTHRHPPERARRSTWLPHGDQLKPARGQLLAPARVHRPGPELHVITSRPPALAIPTNASSFTTYFAA